MSLPITARLADPWALAGRGAPRGRPGDRGWLGALLEARRSQDGAVHGRDPGPGHVARGAPVRAAAGVNPAVELERPDGDDAAAARHQLADRGLVAAALAVEAHVEPA